MTGTLEVFGLILLLRLYLHGELMVICMFLFKWHGGLRECTLTILTLKPGPNVPRQIMVSGTLLLCLLVFLKWSKSMLHLMLRLCGTNVWNLFLGLLAESSSILAAAPDLALTIRPCLLNDRLTLI